MKNNYNFDLFKRDLEDRKQMVLFVGAGINYSKDVKILWDDVINYLFEKTLSRHVIGKNISTDDYCIIKKALGIDSILSNEEIETGLKKFGAMLGDEVEVGCNSVLNPGTVIGKSSNIYPTSMVRGFVPSNSIYKTKTEIAEKY